MHPTIAKLQAKTLKKVPEIKTGFTVRVSQKVSEGSKERIQNFEGLVIKVGHGAGVEKTFTVRKIVEGVGVEKIFPMHSPTLTQIKVLKKAKVRREKLYYMRDRFGKSARLVEKQVTDEERAAEQARLDALYQEAVEAAAENEVKDETVSPAVEAEGNLEAAPAEAQEELQPQEESPQVEASADEAPAADSESAEQKSSDETKSS